MNISGIGSFSLSFVWIVRLFGFLFGGIVWMVLSLNCIAGGAHISGKETLRRAFKLYWYTFLLVFAEALVGAKLRGWFRRGARSHDIVNVVTFVFRYSCKLTLCLVFASAIMIIVALCLESYERRSKVHNNVG